MPLVAIFATAALGNALAPALLDSHPLLLLALNSTTRHLLLTSGQVDVVPWLAVGMARRLLEDPFLYLLGRWYGDGAVAWAERHVGGGRLLRWAQRRFRLVGIPLVALAPGGVVLVLAGASGMGPSLFVALSVVGTVGTLVGLRAFGDTVAGPVGAVVDFTGDNWVVLTAVTVTLTAVWVWRRRGDVAVDP